MFLTFLKTSLCALLFTISLPAHAETDLQESLGQLKVALDTLKAKLEGVLPAVVPPPAGPPAVPPRKPLARPKMPPTPPARDDGPTPPLRAKPKLERKPTERVIAILPEIEKIPASLANYRTVFFDVEQIKKKKPEIQQTELVGVLKGLLELAKANKLPTDEQKKN